MNKKISLGVALALILVAMAVTVSATVMISMRYFSGIVNGVAEREVMYNFIADIDKAVRDHYAGTVDEESLRQALAQGYASGFGDPYAAYYTAEEYAAIVKRLEGKYTGFGLEVTLDGDNIVVSAVYRGSNAEVMGVRKQDIITAIDEEKVDKGDLAAVQRRLNNPAKLLLSITRDGAAHSFTLSSSTTTLDNVENRMLSDGVTGYLYVRSLAENTPEQLRSALSVLQEEGATRYVVDLRDNRGGSMQAALDILDFLLPRGAYARLTMGDSKEPIVYTSTSVRQVAEKLVVLVNENTEAEAELIAGALQECAGAALVGVTTKGHARLQSFFTLKTGNAAVRVSIGTLERIHGGSWEGVGLTPDRAVELIGDTPFILREEKDDEQLQAALVMLGVSVDAGTTTTTATSDSDSTATGTDSTTTTTKK